MTRNTLPPSLPIIWSELAQSRVQEIGDYITQQSPQNALAMVQRLESAVQPLRRVPQLFRISERFPGTREIPVPPYVILYKVSDQAITILTIVHGRRKFPGPDHPKGGSRE